MTESGERRQGIGRRRLLKGTIAGGIAIVCSAIGLVRRGGYAVPATAALVALEPWQYVVVRELARRVCAPDAPDVVTPDEVDVAGFVDAWVAQMPKKQRRDLMRFFAFVEQVAPVTVGLASRFSRLSPDDQDRVLAALESSRIDLLRGGFAGVKALLFMGYYRDPRTWSVIGYPGPFVRRD